MRRMLLAFTLLVGLGTASTLAQAPRPVIDVHIHYSQDAWAMLPPPEAIKVLKQAGLKKAFVSSSSEALRTPLVPVAGGGAAGPATAGCTVPPTAWATVLTTTPLALWPCSQSRSEVKSA